jgi:hypothetical protein
MRGTIRRLRNALVVDADQYSRWFSDADGRSDFLRSAGHEAVRFDRRQSSRRISS